MGLCPIDRGHETIREQPDVKPKFRRRRISEVFVFRKKVEEQGGQSTMLQHFGDRAISRTVPTAATSVRKQHEAMRVWWQAEITAERDVCDVEAHWLRSHYLG
jgi:hypothetical protein